MHIAVQYYIHSVVIYVYYTVRSIILHAMVKPYAIDR